ncbi:MAG: lamin tail domain-containing protein [Parcubacteria group bacterium]|nr:lamin tail domain-containing protein [Parcubacteria group bacterium]
MKKPSGYLIVLILMLLVAGFFYAQKAQADLPVRQAGQNILISQIQIGGTTVTDEFVELYNPNDQPINLSGYRLSKKTASASSTPVNLLTSFANFYLPGYSYYLITHPTGYDDKIAADAVYSTSQSIADNNTIILYSDAGKNIVDKVGYGAASDFETQAVVVINNKLSNNKSIIRKISKGIMQDTDNNANDFEIQDTPTPQNANSPKLMPTENQANSQNTATSTDLTLPAPSQGEENNTASSTNQVNRQIKINFGDIVINELVSDPTDNEAEWLELYNRSGREIDLSGWWLEDGSGAKTKLDGVLDKFKVIDQPAGNLNNSGDLIILYDPSGKIIDRLAYGNWPDGDIENNAPAAGDPNSLARKFDGYNTYNNLNDFALTLKPTKDMANIIQAEDEASAAAKAKFDFSNDILLSEILPNPLGDDTKLEFIELYNASQRAVDLSGWSLSDENNKKINLEKIATSTIIQAGEYLAFFRPRSKLILPNDQGQVKLFQPLANKPLVVVKYKDVKEGWSYVNTNVTNNEANITNKANVDWIWSETPTPGFANIIKTINHAPEADFSFKSPALVNAPVIFDSSDTVDQDDDKLDYTWNFGDGLKNNLANPEHTYLKAGIYKIKLTVSDGKEIGVKEKTIKVVDNISEKADANAVIVAGTSLQPPARPAGESPWQGEGVIINEIFPNPKGADAGGEWLELKNQSLEKINLLNWRVENSNGQYKFNSEYLLAGNAFYVLDNNKSKLTFKNSSDTINLYNDLDELIDAVEYAGAVQGESYARGANDRWFWTVATTPGAENAIKVADSEVSLKYQASLAKAEATDYIATDLEKIRQLASGSLIKVKGTVAVEPGILGAQIFYIVGSPGLEIYNYKKDFPALKTGDYIEVKGELMQAPDEFRLKTKDKTDIKIDEHKAAPAALAISSDQANEELAGRLITVTGEITDKKSSTLYLDDGSDEILIYIKKSTGILIKGLAAGQKAAVTGILTKTKTGFRLLPRYQADIVKINPANELEPRVLGETASTQEWDLAARDKKTELLKYLLIIAAGVIIVLAGLFVKIKRKT